MKNKKGNPKTVGALGLIAVAVAGCVLQTGGKNAEEYQQCVEAGGTAEECGAEVGGVADGGMPEAGNDGGVPDAADGGMPDASQPEQQIVCALDTAGKKAGQITSATLRLQCVTGQEIVYDKLTGAARCSSPGVGVDVVATDAQGNLFGIRCQENAQSPSVVMESFPDCPAVAFGGVLCEAPPSMTTVTGNCFIQPSGDNTISCQTTK